MKLKRQFSLIITVSIILFLYVAIISFQSWFAISNEIKRSNYIQNINYLADKLESDIYQLQNSKAHSHREQWLEYHSQLKQLLTSAEQSNDIPPSTLLNLQHQNNSLGLLFRYFIKVAEDNNNTDIKHHLSTKLLANLQSFQEEIRLISYNSRNSIISLITEQLYYTIPILVVCMAVISIANVYFARWLKQLVLKVNTRLNVLKKGEFGQVVKTENSDEFNEVFDHINSISRSLMETTISRDNLQKIVTERTKELEKLANTDPLTQTATRRVLFSVGEKEFQRAKRSGQSLSVIIIDCDYFKKVNDQYGHLVGDHALTYICTLVTAEIRDIDTLARFGGEEFVALFPDTNAESAAIIASRIQHSLAQSPLIQDNNKIILTVSIGVAELKESDTSFESLIEQADNALYKAKHEGRNKICVA